MAHEMTSEISSVRHCVDLGLLTFDGTGAKQRGLQRLAAAPSPRHDRAPCIRPLRGDAGGGLHPGVVVTPGMEPGAEDDARMGETAMAARRLHSRG